MTTRNRELASIIDDSGNITAGGNLTVSGTTLTSSSTVETHADPLIELNTGAGSNSNDLGFVFERGSTGDNACIIWDESNDAFAVGTTSATGTSTGNMSYTVGDFLAGKVTVDSVLINGTTIGHTSDTDLLTLADGLLTVAGEISVTTLDIGGTNVTSTAAELNILDGVNSTAAELNILDGVTATATEINLLDGDTSATGTTLAAADRVIVNDAGTMKQVALSDFETFFESEIDTFSTIDINGGSIDGATVGTNSAAAGSFTTLAASGAITGTLGTAAQTNITSLGTLTALTVDNIALNGNTMTTTSADFTLDASHDIILDADGGDVILRDGGTSFLTATHSSGDVVLTSNVDDKDIIFKGYDGGSLITALTLDMSDAGAASFTNTLTTAGSITSSGGAIYATSSSGSQFYALQVSRSSAGGTAPDIWSDANYVSLGHNSSTQMLNINATGVGIGTAANAPTYLLDVESTTAWGAIVEVNQKSNGTEGAQLFLKHQSASPADEDYLGFVNFKGMNDAAQEVQYARIDGISADVTDGTEDGRLVFNTAVAGAANTLTMALTGGKVGIGTASPAELLDLGGNNVKFRMTAASDANYRFEIENRYDGGNTINWNGTSGVNLMKWIANTTSFSMMTAGEAYKVGIGTTTPQKKLHIEHAAGASEGILISGASDSTGHTAGILLRAEGGEADSALRAKGGIFLERTATYGIGKLHIANKASADNVSATISDANITIFEDKVGIGTTAPADKFHINTGVGDGHAFGGKSLSLTTSFQTGAQLAITLGNHQGCFVKVFITGDWSSHSAIAFLGEYFIQNGADGYAEPGIIIREIDNTATVDSLSSQIVDSSDDTFQIQFKLNQSLGANTASGQLQYQIMGQFDTIA